MAESNNEKKFESMFYEADIIEGWRKKSSYKRGKGSENKQKVLMVLFTRENNKYPRYMKFHTLPGLMVGPIRP